MKKVRVITERYEASDGSLHETERECRLRELLISNKIRVCTSCNGAKQVIDVGGRHYEQCSGCNGTGYQESKVVWVPVYTDLGR